MEIKDSGTRKTVTPIKRAIKFQKEKETPVITDIEDSRFKKYEVSLNGRSIMLKYDANTDEIIIDGKLYPTKLVEKNGNFIVTVGDNHHYVIEHHDGQVFLEGRMILFDYKPMIPKLSRSKSAIEKKEIIKAPLPGIIIAISVNVGDKVEKGQKIVVLEAMKMQNELISQIFGTIKEIYVNEGDSVNQNDPLVLISKV